MITIEGEISPPELLSGKTHSINEGNGLHLLSLSIEELNEPLKLLLENILTLSSASVTKLREKCIQTRFCGLSLITTVKNGHAVIINRCDLIAVQINETHTFDGDNFGVIALPILIVFDGSDHLLFDLTHETEEKEQRREGRDPLHSLKIVDFGVCAKKMCHLGDRPPAAAILNNKSS